MEVRGFPSETEWASVWQQQRGMSEGQFCAMGHEAVEAIDMSLIEKLTLLPGPGEPLEGSELRQDMVSVAV